MTSFRMKHAIWIKTCPLATANNAPLEAVATSPKDERNERVSCLVLYAPLGLFAWRYNRDSFVLPNPGAPGSCKTLTNIQKAKRSVQRSYSYCLRQSKYCRGNYPGENRSLWNVSILNAMMMEMHIVLHSHNSIFVFACLFAFLFSLQFLNTRGVLVRQQNCKGKQCLRSAGSLTFTEDKKMHPSESSS